MSNEGEAKLASKAVSRFLRSCARLSGVPWSDELHAEILAAIAAAIRARSIERPPANLRTPSAAIASRYNL